MEIKLASHEHPMDYHWFHESDYKKCDKCREKICGAAYACVRCGFGLHESCAKSLQHLPREITHPLHSHHHLVLDWSGPPRKFTCDLCLKASSGTNYGCCRCKFEVDLACAFAGGDDHWTRMRSDAARDHVRIQHYCHRHSLILYKFSSAGETDYNCSWCDKPLTGTVYGCKGCSFFLHEFCTDEIPKTLNHPFHPSHPLRLGFHDYVNSNTRRVLYCEACRNDVGGGKFKSTASYGCQKCGFYLDIDCAKLSPTLKHECHNHNLTYVGRTFGKRLQNFRCHSCRELFSGTRSLYRCVHCDLNFHLKCVSVPPLAENRYHRHPLILSKPIREDEAGECFCDICEKERNPTHEVYFCQECTFIAHIECTLNRTEASPKPDSSSAPIFMEQTETTLFRPVLHVHPLKFCKATDEILKHQRCTLCRLDVSGPRYFCEKCLHERGGVFRPNWGRSVFVHEDCAKLADEIQHPLHPQHQLFLSAGALGLILCDECQGIFLGFVYRCKECDFKLDLKCATRAPSERRASTSKEWERETELFHFSHNHNLIFGNYPDTLRQIECRFCGLQILGPTYWCMRCNWFIHESCVRLPEEMRVPLHSQHSLTLKYSRTLEGCHACGASFCWNGGSYGCKDCGLHFHIACAISLRRPLKRDSHLHRLYYFGAHFHRFFARYPSAELSCCRCDETCSGQSFYRCLECRINFHIKCVPVPQAVESKIHIHPLVLKDFFTEDDSEKYYCDACEEERHPKDHVYLCKE
ncbi:Detected protein of unknown function [Hibiscus syriacus]|uniref:Phorbol-ester/DAG-type domain-containing protein n=1 Tax=Hibiscus syriacus TaxID=106335 RepID=A0A6A2Y2A7_HIBSY|nr:uncharacterized protein LOC120184241 [Hibiscus syriacus]KAE8663927.1 Detected protein of unknown function [Hibiscus syriacus]